MAGDVGDSVIDVGPGRDLHDMGVEGIGWVTGDDGGFGLVIRPRGQPLCRREWASMAPSLGSLLYSPPHDLLDDGGGSGDDQT